MCIEAQPSEFEKLKSNRNCICVNVAVSNFEGETDFTYVEGYANMLSGISDDYNKTHMERIKGEVNHYGGKINTIKLPVKKLQTVLDEHNMLNIDFCSIDTEGSELNIIKSIDFNKTNIKVFIIENNYKETNIQEYLESKGYSLHKKLEWDESNLIQNPKSKIQNSEIEKFKEAVDDDFNFPGGLAVIFELAKELIREGNIIVHQGKTETSAHELLEKWQTLITLADVLGLTAQPEVENPVNHGISDVDIEELIQKRQVARKAKNFAESDQIRDQLLKKGVTLIDSKEGTRWHKG
jgi:FkbM family methyltransferase